MNKKIQSYGSLGLMSMVWMGNASALTGNMFQVTSTGTAATIPIELCLSAGTSKPNSQSGCERFTTTGTTLNIRLINLKALQAVRLSACKTYTNVGIKVLSSGYTVEGGLPYNLTTGYSVFSANCSGDSTVTLASTTGTTTLTASVPELALSVNKSGTNAALTGSPRQITINNNGTIQATGLNIAYSSSLPTGTTASSDCGATLEAGGACTITITPGANATNGCDTSYTAPTPTTITVSASNVNTPVTSNVVVLGYGCQYQSGFLYSVNDTTSNAGSIGGKVISLIDQKDPYINSSTAPGPGIPWDADPACATNPFQCTKQTNAWDLYYGMNSLSVPGSTNPNNTGTNGPGNTYLISSILTAAPNYGNTNTPIATYAAGVCITYNAGNYTNWYLPAICEMGPNSNGSGCTAGTQNMVDNLSSLIGDPGAQTPSTSCTTRPGSAECLAGEYWSSTEYSDDPQSNAWSQKFSSGGSSQASGGKDFQLGVRCSRAF